MARPDKDPLDFDLKAILFFLVFRENLVYDRQISNNLHGYIYNDEWIIGILFNGKRIWSKEKN